MTPDGQADNRHHDGVVGLAVLPHGLGDGPTRSSAPRSTVEDGAILAAAKGFTGHRSSGTTPGTHGNLLASAIGTTGRFEVGPDDTGVVGTPLYHASGGMILTTSLLAGSSLVLVDEWDPEDFLATVEAHGGTFTNLITTLVADLVHLETGVLESYDTGSFRVTL